MQSDHKNSDFELPLTDIAIVGLSCQYPGADNVEEFWYNITHKIDSITRFSKEELKREAIPEELRENPLYVGARGILNNVEKFDANFFGYNPFDARKTDPQIKLFLEHAWQALESAGYTPEKCKDVIGVYASMADSTYVINNLLKNKEASNNIDWFQMRITNSLFSLSTQVSYRLNLTGPSININTACSSSLVAITTACQGLIDYNCDLAIAGAAAIHVPQRSGYLYQEGGIESPDGYCRAYDANANGTVFSNGLGVVILKRLQDAVQDGDYIYAVIKGWNVNNDGNDKAGFTAPSINGQAKCIVGALAFANVQPDSLQYIEGHGTGTTLGDAIELQALTKAFALQTEKKQFCAIGSVKTNIGHTEIAAGMASFIKTTLSLKEKVIPPSLHFTTPNLKIAFANTPFYVNTELKKWDFGTLPRRAGINTSGIGGTNAFLVLEEFVQSRSESQSRPFQLLLLSAKTEKALERQTQNLYNRIAEVESAYEFANIAYTLQVGRADFKYRKALLCTDPQDALKNLLNVTHSRVHNLDKSAGSPNIVFMFSGQGTQYIGMGKGLYYAEPEFSKLINKYCEMLEPMIKEKVHAFILGTLDETEATDTLILQPALFILEYALANFWIDLGVQPNAMIGHSLGEYVAACISGVMSFKDALKLVCLRAELMATTNTGLMLAINEKVELISPLLKDYKVSIAAINTPNSCVISGEPNSIIQLEQKFEKLNISSIRLKINRAFHSELMEPILDSFKKVVEEINLKAPNIPIISNLHGKWVKKEEVTKPEYWVNHLRQTVNFFQGMQTLAKEGYQVFIEIGPGKTLLQFARDIVNNSTLKCIQNTLPPIHAKIPDQEQFLITLGKIWQFGVVINWDNYYKYEKRYRIPIPTYPFERKAYWISADNAVKLPIKAPINSTYFYEPSWERSSSFSSDISKSFFSEKACWIIFLDKLGLGEKIFKILSDNQQTCIVIKTGPEFKCISPTEYVVSASYKEDFEKIIQSTRQIIDELPIRILNLFSFTPEHNLSHLDLVEIEEAASLGFYSIVFFVQALDKLNYNQNIKMLIVGNELCSVTNAENICPAKATVIGPTRVIPLETPELQIKIFDILLSDYLNNNKIAAEVILEMLNFGVNDSETIVALRDIYRWKQTFKPIHLVSSQKSNIKPLGLYLFIGGLGGIGLTLAKYIAKSAKGTKIVLTYRSSFPPEIEWSKWLEEHGNSDPISKKILQVQTLKTLGAEVLIYKVNIENFEELKNTINNIKKHGTITGVVHAAGISGNVSLTQKKSFGDIQQVLASKIQGPYILNNLLLNENPDFVIFCSSLSSIVGALGRVEYAAANACLDAFVNIKTPNNLNIKCINWNIWQEVGMAADIVDSNINSVHNNNSISPEEGSNIFNLVLSNNYKQVIISGEDIQKGRHAAQKNKPGYSHSPIFHTIDNTNSPENTLNTVKNNVQKLWQNVLGIEDINTNDNFYELGGDSLTMLRLLSQIEKTFNIKISLRILQELKTIDEFTQKIVGILENSNRETTYA